MPKSKTQKQDEAQARQKAHAALPLKDKIAQCELRRGKSKRELSKLRSQEKAGK